MIPPSPAFSWWTSRPPGFAHAVQMMRMLTLQFLGLVLIMAVIAPRAKGETRLITHDLAVESIRLSGLDNHQLTYQRAEHDGTVTLSTDRALALILNDRLPLADLGMLRLNDGQQFPGEALYGVDSPEDVFVWSHPRLGRLDIPVDRIASVSLDKSIPAPAPRNADVIVLANGDEVSGFVISLGDPVQVEVNADQRPEVLEIPLRRIAALALVTPKQPPTGRRIWLTDGSILSAETIRLEDEERFRVTFGASGFLRESISHSTDVQHEHVAAVELHPARLTPLASLRPRRVEGPQTRYIVPAPTMVVADALLDLSPVEFRGPIAAHYLLPTGVRRFAAEAELPREARAWGDFDLIVRVDGAIVFRRRFDADQPRAEINLPVNGSELTIELTDGPHGAIQNRLVLRDAMLLVEPH